MDAAKRTIESKSGKEMMYMQRSGWEFALQDCTDDEIGDLVDVFYKWLRCDDPIRSCIDGLQLCGRLFPEDINCQHINEFYRLYESKRLALHLNIVRRFSEDHVRYPELTTRMSKVFHCLVELFNVRRSFTRLRQPYCSRFVPDFSIYDHLVWNDLDVNKMNAFQKAVYMALEYAHQHGFVRFGCAIMAPVFYDGEFCHHYRRHCTVKEFVYIMMTHAASDVKWMLGTQNPNMLRHVQENLENSSSVALPAILPDRHYFAFRNGLYHDKSDTFFTWKRSIDESDGATVYEEAPTDAIACKFFDMDFHFQQQHGHNGHFFPGDELVKTDAEFSAQMDIGGHGDFMAIPTPNFDLIFDYQWLKADSPDARRHPDAVVENHQLVKMFFFAALGRCLYRVNEMDGWQIMPILLGEGGAGKSSVANILTAFFNHEDVGTLVGKQEKVFGLWPLYDKFLFIMSETSKTMNLDLGDLLSMIVGESTLIREKYGKAFSVIWEVPGFAMGNDVPGYEDKRGALSRRFWPAKFERKIENPDHDIERDCIKDEIGNVLLKVNRAYLSLLRFMKAHEYKHVNRVWPDYFTQQQEDFRTHVNVLEAFLKHGNVIVDPTRYYPVDGFKHEFHEFCKLNNYTIPEWTECLYKSTFSRLSIVVTGREERCWPVDQRRSKQTRIWLAGVAVVASFTSVGAMGLDDGPVGAGAGGGDGGRAAAAVGFRGVPDQAPPAPVRSLENVLADIDNWVIVDRQTGVRRLSRSRELTEREYVFELQRAIDAKQREVGDHDSPSLYDARSALDSIRALLHS